MASFFETASTEKWLSSLTGVCLFTVLFGISLYLGDLYVKWRDGSKKEISKEELEKSEVDLQKLIDAQKEKDYSRGSETKYDWTQNEHEIEMHVKIPKDQEFSDEQIAAITKKDVKCIIKSSKIEIRLYDEMLLEGEFYAPVDPDECNWQLMIKNTTSPTIWLSLFKKVPTVRKQFWKCVILGDEKVVTNQRGAPIFTLGGDDPNEMKSAMASLRQQQEQNMFNK